METVLDNRQRPEPPEAPGLPPEMFSKERQVKVRHTCTYVHTVRTCMHTYVGIEAYLYTHTYRTNMHTYIHRDRGIPVRTYVLYEHACIHPYICTVNSR